MSVPWNCAARRVDYPDGVSPHQEKISIIERVSLPKFYFLTAAGAPLWERNETTPTTQQIVFMTAPARFPLNTLNGIIFSRVIVPSPVSCEATSCDGDVERTSLELC